MNGLPPIPLRVIVAGSRTCTDPQVVDMAMDQCIREHGQPCEIVSGGCRGVDAMGESWGTRRGLPVRKFPAEWVKHGRAAGPIRNELMARYGHVLVAVWDGSSPGTANMISCMRELRKPFIVWRC